MPKNGSPIKGLRTGIFSRGAALLRASIKAGGMRQLDYLVEELGQLKGTGMKVAQTLSVYGEQLLPKELNDLLKTLQQDSPPVDWQTMCQVLESELSTEILNELEIEEKSSAAASIGQVHKARVKSTGQLLALKIQYPGVDEAIDSDLKVIKFLLGLTHFIPKGPRTEQIFEEVRDMLKQEVDFRYELDFTNEVKEWLSDSPVYVVPTPIARYSSRRVIATNWIAGHRADGPDVLNLPLERRNQIGKAYLELYVRELFERHLVQTDPHLGNYLIQIDPHGDDDKLVLLDFGACRRVPAPFLADYIFLAQGAFNRDSVQIEKGARRLGLIHTDDSMSWIDNFVHLCCLLSEPFAKPEWPDRSNWLDNSGSYDWGQSDLAARVTKLAKSMALSHRIHTPPRELVFIDRKAGGVFSFLSVMKCKTPTREIVEYHLNNYLNSKT